MTRFFLTAATAIAFAVTASAHFVFVIPTKDAKSVQVVLSDELEPDDGVEVAKIAGTKLTVVTADGKSASLPTTKGEHALTAVIPTDARIISGSCEYGVMARGDAKPYLLMYHPKTVFAGCDEKTATLGAAAVVEIVPSGTSGKMAFLVLAAGKPVADAEVNLMLPDGKKEKVKTDKDGKTKVFAATGRYGAWAKVTEAKAGTLGDKKYEEARHYATLVVDVK